MPSASVSTGINVGPIVPVSNPIITTGVLVGATLALASIYAQVSTAILVASRWVANSGAIATGRYRR